MSSKFLVMKRNIILLWIIVLATFSVSAQLPRRAFLGLQLLEVNDSVARIHRLEHPQGVLVVRVVDGSSAQAMGIEAHDLILSVDTTQTHSPEEVIRQIGLYRAGETLQITTMRQGEVIKRSGELQPLPKETSPHGEVIYDQVPFDGGYIRTIIHKPATEGKLPALFFIQGYTCVSMDRMHAEHPYTKMINGLTEKGYVVVKTEKAGTGDSQNERDCSQYDLFEEVELFAASYNALKKYDFIDPDNIFIFGHSMGGVQAPLMQTDFPPKGIAVYGTVIRPWFEYFVEHARIQKFIMGIDYLENEAMHETAVKFYYRLMIDKQTPAQLALDPDVKEFMTHHFGWDGADIFLGRHFTFWQQLQDTRLFTAWANTPAHVLSLWGEGEFIAFNPYEHQLIADVVNRYNPGKAEFIRIPNMDHSFLWVEDQQHAVAIRGDWEYTAQNFNHDIVEILQQWMEDLVRQ